MTSPQEYFGFCPGEDKKLIRWEKLVSYYTLLEKESGNIKVIHKGKSTLGNPLIQVIISSEENIRNINKIRDISYILANQSDFSDAELSRLLKDGKCVCVQNMSTHAKEVGGTQMAPLLAYHLISDPSEEVKKILDNVLLILVPCANPDGEIMVTDFYNKYIGTEFEGTTYPDLYHIYAGHDNNRDAVFCNLSESKFLRDTLIKDYCPQVFIDHHQMGLYDIRMFIPPYKDKVLTYISPLVLREQNMIGTYIANDLELKGVQGVGSNMLFANMGLSTFVAMACAHNITGFLTESAQALIASPHYVLKEHLHDKSLLQDTVGYEPCEKRPHYPNHWEGGYWRLSDVVRQQFIAGLSALKFMSLNREMILKSAAEKSKRQTAYGKKEKFSYFVINNHQSDMSAKNKLLSILFEHNIKMYRLNSNFICDGMHIEKNSVLIPVAQPKYALIMGLLERKRINETDSPKRSSQLEVCEIKSLFHVKTEKVKEIPASMLSEYEPSLDANQELLYQNTQSYAEVNKILDQGEKVYRGKDRFLLSGAREVKSAKIGVYARYFAGNTEQGWTRYLLDQFHFDNRLIRDKDITSGLDGTDILILPDDIPSYLTGDIEPEHNPWLGLQPKEYMSGLKERETDHIIKFVSEGGKLIAFNRSCSYVISAFRLSLKNTMENVSKENNLTGSVYRMKADGELAGEYNVVNLDSPCFSVTDYQNREDYRVLGEYPNSDLLTSGYYAGEKYLRNKASIIKVKYLKGEIVLFGFSPIYRAQSYNTFKLLFNELYTEEDHGEGV